MSINTLVVSYLPGGKASNTKKLLDYFLENVKNAGIETLDLIKTVPDFFTPASLAVYYERNYGGRKPDPSREGFIKKMDNMTRQLQSAEVAVLVYPMHNFSIPAAVKAWFDSVMQKGQTWDVSSKGGFLGKLSGKKALVLSTSGGVYEGDTASYDLATPVVRTEFLFMGFSEVEFISAGGMNSLPENKKKESLDHARKKIGEIIAKWYEI
ncbi:MAG: NAD(P)H-dependent oxidoreductase [Candidatus Aureabacteria bacterium]|nr:NAD(P)H-dependent oxidoreductase [Candidatus Auribacterota bacterium]